MPDYCLYITPRRNGRFADVTIKLCSTHYFPLRYMCEINPEDVGEIAIAALNNPIQFLTDVLGQEPTPTDLCTTYYYHIYQEESDVQVS